MSKPSVLLKVLLFVLLLCVVSTIGAQPAAAGQSGPALGTEQAAARPATGWLSGWTYRRALTISNAGAALSEYQVRVALDSAFIWGHANSDGSDVRFTTGDGTTTIPFWIESWAPPTSANLWIKVLSIASGPAATTIYLYYGKADASSASNGNSTFILFDDNWSQFASVTGNPVITAKQNWWESTVSYPMIFEDTSFLPGRPRYHMLYDGHGVLPGSHAKGYAYSSDLNSWTEYDSGLAHPPNPNPIVGPGTYTGADNFAWGDGIKVGSTYYIYPFKFGAGAAVRVQSTDLEHWSNIQALTVNGDSAGIGTGVAILKQGDGITPIQVGGKYWMIYFHGDSPGSMYLASADPSDLLTWASTGTPLLNPRPGSWDASGLWTPSFVQFGNKYYIYYQGDGGPNGWVTGFASAPALSGGNPITPYASTWTQSAQPSLLHGVSFDTSYSIDPSVRQFSNGIYYLFYTGDTANGYATATSPDGPWTKNTPSGGSGIWNTGGAPTVSSGILSLASGAWISSKTAYAYDAVGFKSSFPGGQVLVWGGFINGSSNDRAMIGTVRTDSSLYLKNLNGGGTQYLSPLTGSWLDAFHVYEVLWASGKTTGMVDHGLAANSQASGVPSVGIPVTLYNYESTAAFKVDWVFVRQYHDPEAAVTLPLGTEETTNPTAVTLEAFNARAESASDSMPAAVLALAGIAFVMGSFGLWRRRHSSALRQ